MQAYSSVHTVHDIQLSTGVLTAWILVTCMQLAYSRNIMSLVRAFILMHKCLMSSILRTVVVHSHDTCTPGVICSSLLLSFFSFAVHVIVMPAGQHC